MYATDNEISIPVTSWTASPAYAADTAGSYSFTATLGELPDGFELGSGLTLPVINVTLKDSVATLAELTEALATINASDLTAASLCVTQTIQVASTVTLESTTPVTLTVAGNRRHFNISSGGNLTLDDGLTLTRAAGHTGTGGGVDIRGGIFNMLGGEISGNGLFANGGGVWNEGGTFIMDGGEISGNATNSYGGGVYVSNGTFTMSGGAISNNSAGIDGGGVYIVDNSTFTMSGGIISGNTTHASHGGGVHVKQGCTFNMSSGRIVDNTAKDQAGGVHLAGGTFNMSGDAEISGNSAPKNGGGVCFDRGATFTMSGGRIFDNSATNGGGIQGADSDTTFNMSDNAQISGNTATNGGGIYMRGSVTVSISGGQITDNEAVNGGGIYGAALNILRSFLTIGETVNFEDNISTALGLDNAWKIKAGSALMISYRANIAVPDGTWSRGLKHGYNGHDISTAFSADDLKDNLDDNDKPEIPGTPGSVTVESDKDGNVTIIWDEPTDGGAVEEYEIEITDNINGDKETHTISGSDDSFELSLPDGSYSVRIRAKNRSGDGTDSDSVNVMVKRMFEVSFHVNDASTDKTIVDVIPGESVGTVNVPADPDRAGFDFLGWYGEQYGPLVDAREFDPDMAITENVSIFARWNPPEVHFYNRGELVNSLAIGLGGGTSLTDNDKTLPAAPAAQLGQSDFLGWYTESDEAFTADYIIADSMAVYAIWETDEILPEEPGQPGDVTVEVEDDTIIVTWTEPTDGGETDTYEIIITDEEGNETVITIEKDKDSGEWTATDEDGNEYEVVYDDEDGSFKVIIDDLEDGSYSVRVRTKNRRGMSESEPVVVVVEKDDSSTGGDNTGGSNNNTGGNNNNTGGNNNNGGGNDNTTGAEGDEGHIDDPDCNCDECIVGRGLAPAEQGDGKNTRGKSPVGTTAPVVRENTDSAPEYVDPAFGDDTIGHTDDPDCNCDECIVGRGLAPAEQGDGKNTRGKSPAGTTAPVVRGSNNDSTPEYVDSLSGDTPVGTTAPVVRGSSGDTTAGTTAPSTPQETTITTPDTPLSGINSLLHGNGINLNISPILGWVLAASAAASLFFLILLAKRKKDEEAEKRQRIRQLQARLEDMPK